VEKIASGKDTRLDVSQGGWEAWGTLVITEIERLSDGLKEATAALQETRESRIKALGEIELRTTEHLNELQEKLIASAKVNCSEHKAEFEKANDALASHFKQLYDDLDVRVSRVKEDIIDRVVALEHPVAELTETINAIKVKLALLYGGFGILLGLLPTLIHWVPIIFKLIIEHL